MRILLFTGKGGVGKTTLAAATAAHLAVGGRKVLVVSTDPAHSLADALGVPLGPEPAEVPLPSAGTESTSSALDSVESLAESQAGDGRPEGQVPSLYAAEVATRRLVDDAWTQLRTHLRTILLGAGVSELESEELTQLPGVEDLLALSEVQRLAEQGPWDSVLVDCGPTAETLRLLALPEGLSGYLERLFPTHRRVVRGLLAGMAGSSQLEQWDAAADAIGRLAQRLGSLSEMLGGTCTSVRLVLTPESVVAAETRRTLTALALQQIHVDGIIANRLVPHPGSARGTAAAWLRTRRSEQDAVLDDLKGLGAPLRCVEHRAAEPAGVAALVELGAQLYGEDDPVAIVGRAPEITVTGGGRSLDAEYSLRIAMPLHEHADLELARVGDELAVTVDGRRRLIALPAVLRRCVVADAVAGDDGVTVAFRPDPDLWMR